MLDQLPTKEELERRKEMRKEQGRKLKELMDKKREEKKKNQEKELADLQHIEQCKQEGIYDVAAFKEEISHRGFSTIEDFNKRLNTLQIKLNVKTETEDEMPPTSSSQALDQKYHLVNIADAFLTPDQLKQKRIQKMQKTAHLMREEKKKV